MLFLFTMELLQILFKKAHEVNLLQKLRPNCDTCKVSLYTDDAALFIQPNAQALKVADHILNLFAEASGLMTNMAKTFYYPIRCQGLNLDFLNQTNIIIGSFPCNYLGLPLSTKRLARVDLQPVIQKITNRLPGWTRKFFTYPGRELLIKIALSSIPTHFLSIYKMPLWAIYKLKRSFSGEGNHLRLFSGGHCLINWLTSLRPRKWGGLSFKDIENFGRALRLRWLWNSWDEK
jgi:hypothetical protein